MRVVPLMAVFSEGIYPAVVERLEPQDGVYNREYLRWSFNLKTAKGEEVTCTGLTSTTFTPKSKFYKWASAITGREFQINDWIDTAQLHSVPCRVFSSSRNWMEVGASTKWSESYRVRFTVKSRWLTMQLTMHPAVSCTNQVRLRTMNDRLYRGGILWLHTTAIETVSFYSGRWHG
jgi:hypothetical protein